MSYLINSDSDIKDVRITLVYDNVAIKPGLQPGQGFACIVETGGTTLLFDTGDDGLTLLHNLAYLGFAPSNIRTIILSHNRSGHIGGLDDFLTKNSRVHVYVPASFPCPIINSILEMGADVIPVSDTKEILPNVFALGEFIGIFKEQAIAIKSKTGIIVITGCAHEKVIEILQKAKDIFPNDKLYLLIGGIHLTSFNYSENQNILFKLKNLNLKKIACSHCCEAESRHILMNTFGKDFIDIGVGSTIKINNTNS